MTPKKQSTKKKNRTLGMKLWRVKRTYQFLGPNEELLILTRSRNLGLAVVKAEAVIRRDSPGRRIDSIEYEGIIDN
jgi:hypothetical protein